MLSGTKLVGHTLTQVEFEAINNGATVVLQLTQVYDVLMQLAQYDAQGSHSMADVLAIDNKAGHVITHCCL